MAATKHHVVLLPFMAQGHLTPFLSLAEHIHHLHPSLTVTLVNTPSNILSLSSSLPPDSPIRLHSLPFSPSDHNLPPNAENTASLPYHLFPTLFRASQSLRPAFEALISDLTRRDGGVPPLCIISDNFFAWTVDVANKFHSSHAVFFTSSAYGAAVLISLWLNLPHTKTTSNTFPLPNFPEIEITRSHLPKHLLAADGTDPWSLFFQRQISNSMKSDSILIHTAKEFETIGLAMFRKAVGGIPVYPVGPLLRTPDTSSSQRHFVEWLEFHPARSVVYISFGSQNTIRAAQMMELARGLEASGQPFIWVIRPPVEFDISAEFKVEWLPEGFEERMAAARQGMVVHGWAPQVEILGHGSTGAFLSHCGWNSVLESLSRGVPIIGWPLSADQLYNSTMLEEVGVCLEVARGNWEDSRVEGGEVERVVGVVLGGTDKGREMRRRAVEVGEVLVEAWREEEGGCGGGGGSSTRELNDFLQSCSCFEK